jgi:hypothetical protein
MLCFIVAEGHAVSGAQQKHDYKPGWPNITPRIVASCVALLRCTVHAAPCVRSVRRGRTGRARSARERRDLVVQALALADLRAIGYPRVSTAS